MSKPKKEKMPSTTANSGSDTQKNEVKKFSAPKSFSRNHLIIFAAVFGVIGGFLLWRAFAAGGILYSQTSTMPDGGTISGQYGWSVSINPSPKFVEFYVDGAKVSTDSTAPFSYGSTGKIDTTKLSKGMHYFKENLYYQNATIKLTHNAYVDNTGATTPSPVTPPVTPPPPTTPPPGGGGGSSISCTKTTTTSSGSLQSFVDSIGSGQTGCLRAGTYSSGVTFRNSGATIASYPGERATINGYTEVSRGATGVKLSHLNFSVPGTQHTIRIYGNNAVIEYNNFTNNNAVGSGSCVGVGGSQDRPSGVVIRGNVIQNCGSNQDNLNHGIYALSFTDLTIVDNIFYRNGGYSIQLYPDGTRATVSHNIIDGSNEYSVRGGIIIDGTTAVNHIIENNIIVYAATAGITARTGSGHVARNNCFYSNKSGDISGSMTQSGNTNANPNFVNKTARNYQLASGSLCLSVVGYDTAKKNASL